MADRRVAIRLGSEGKATVVADLNEIGTTGDAAFNRVARAAKRSGEEATAAYARAQRDAKKLEALMPGLNPTRLDANVGIRDGVGVSAKASASVFSAAYAQMEARAEALRQAIDPVYAAQQRFDRELAEARALISAGVISLDEYSKRLVQLRGGLDDVRTVHGRAGGASRQMQMAMAGASYQVQDLATQISMGANPINAFVVQGGQLAGQFMNVEGKAGALAKFMMGGWGIALQIGLMALAPLVAKLWEESDAAKAARDAKEEHRKAVLALADAQGKAIQTAERRQALDVGEIKVNLDAAIAERTRAAATLERARAIAALAAAEASTGSGSADEAIAKERDAVAAQRRVAELEKQMATNNSEIARLQKGVDLGFARMINQRVEAQSTPEGRIRRTYEDQASRAQLELSGTANAGKLRAKLEEIYAARDRELKALEKSTQARTRDAETVTANQVAKLLRDELPGVAITSTTGGKHTKNSYHYRPGGQAVDFVPAGGMSSMSKDDVRRIFESRGIQIVELLGPGDKGHSDHFHVAWTKGKLALDGFTDAAKRAKEEQKGLDDAAEKILRNLVKPELGTGTDFMGDLVAGIDARRGVKQDADEYASGLINDQRDRRALAERELQLVGANDNYREAELAKLRLILDLRGRTVDTEKGLGAEILANAEALDRVYARLRRQEAIWNELMSVGNSAIDTLFDPKSADSWGDRVKAVLNDLKNEFITLALLNPVKNMLFGTDAPTLSGVFGRLFGGSKAGAGLTSHGKAMPFATGTEYAPGGTALVGEEGPEVINLPRGSRVSTAAATRQLFASANDNAGGNSYHFDLRGAVMTEDLLRQMNAIGDASASRGAAGGAAMATRSAIVRRRRSFVG